MRFARHWFNITADFKNTITLNWQRVRKQALSQCNICEACGYKKNLHVHHIKPRHLFPELALEINNLIVLCKDCHFHLGHSNNFRNYVPHIKNICKSIVSYKEILS